MRYCILYDSEDRIRVRIPVTFMSAEHADILENYLLSLHSVKKVKVDERTCSSAIDFKGDKAEILRAISAFDFSDTNIKPPEHSGRALQRQFEDKLFSLVAVRCIKNFLLPLPIRFIWTSVQSVGYIFKGLKCLCRGKLESPVLDAATIFVSVMRRDFKTAGSIIFLLHLGALLEDWTHKRSIENLARQMLLNVEKVWLKSGKEEKLVSVDSVRPGEHIMVRSGNLIPLDGVVCAGEASVNQSTMTGESLPVYKNKGSLVYAGTAVEEGYCEICVSAGYGTGRYDRIVNMIEQSNRLKSETESRAEHLADLLVPYSLAATILAYMLTGRINKALSILMVDYSCALRLAIPVAVLTAMRECGNRSITVKGGKFLEAVAEAKTVVFDKTGTLTHAAPKLEKIICFGGNKKRDMLLLAACLEEHYPHSIANSIVNAAKKERLYHPERHSEIEYIVAHGIASIIDGKHVAIGSHHFIFEDENCALPVGGREIYETLPEGYTYLYLAENSVLSAVFCIADPVRAEAAETIRRLHDSGIENVVMMTGDGEKTASAVAEKLGIDKYFSEVLPEEKAQFIRKEHEAGRRVIMIGDGVNDSPALSEADVGVAIAGGAAIAREVSDITVSDDDLRKLVELRILSTLLMERISLSYRQIISLNSFLILAGYFGLLPPTSTAMMHNISTLIFTLRNMKNLINE